MPLSRPTTEERTDTHLSPSVSDAAPGSTPHQGDAASWHPVQKFFFRFGSLYFLWYALPDFLTPGQQNNSLLTDRLSAWVGEVLLGLGPVSIELTAAGDRLVLYLKMLVMVVTCLVLATLWSILDRKRPNYQALGHWMMVACRYYLMSVMLTYGFAKIFGGQFTSPSLARLLQSFGEASPMGLLWTTMGYSKAYTLFGGLGEVIGALLLTMRRTSTLGAMIIVGVMSNVVMMNFAYDVPVKLYSSHLLILAIVLVAVDARRVLGLLVFNRPVAAAVYRPHFSDPRRHRASMALKALVIGYFLLINAGDGLRSMQLSSDGAPKPPLWGIYDVESFVLDGEERPPLLTDTERWQNLVFTRDGKLVIRQMDGTMERYSATIQGGTLTFYQEWESRTELSFERPSAEILQMVGEFDGRAVALRMKARDVDDFTLTSRGFHWVNETPFDPLR